MDIKYDPVFFELLASNYHGFTGKDLAPPILGATGGAKWLYEDATFCVLAHNTALDPVFIYGNQAAQLRFEYSWEELVTLPSRLSAEAPNREERQRFLSQVQRDGFVSGYRGLRIAKSGKRFWIEDATIWQLTDKNGHVRGQAALLPHTIDME